MGYIISTKGRYALRVMIDLARNGKGGKIPLKEIAERQEISLKYLETIMPSLIKANLVVGSHGKGGGYSLSRPPEDYTVGEILRVTEGSIAPVACLECGFICDRAESCNTLPLWRKLDEMITNYLNTVKLVDLLSGDIPGVGTA